MRRRVLCLALALPSALLAGWGAFRVEAGGSDEPRPSSNGRETPASQSTGRSSGTWTTAVVPKPLSAQVKKGLDWLVEHQHPDGGWSQGEESSAMRGSGDGFRDRPNVADTCAAALALIRSGSHPREGPYRGAVAKAVRFVLSQVEGSDSTSISVTSVQGTRVQQKLGPNIDTFLASMLLAEVKDRMPDPEGDKRVDVALEKVLGKINRHQKDDGSFDGGGWAPVLAQAMCGKGINRARQAGARVSDVALARATNGAKLAFSADRSVTASTGYAGAPASAAFAGGRTAGLATSTSRPARGDAGVELYARAASVGVLQDSVNTAEAREPELHNKAQNAKDAKERDKAKTELAAIEETKQVQRRVRSEVVERLGDRSFVAGFGSNGGEEFLSYMNIAESLVVKGGDEWKRWDASMTQNLNRIQNDDGSWTGHHCITGRTFCTSTALLVLMADRTPIPVVSKDGQKPTAK
jgi:hypothetical protein